MTSNRVIKSIILIIASAFLLAQYASVSHAHSDDDHDLTPCAVCVVSTFDDGDSDNAQPTLIESEAFTIANVEPVFSADTPRLMREDNSAPPPPDIRPSAPRAPPA